MSVTLINYPVYFCRCDKCLKSASVERDDDAGIYNGAQAVRSLGWSFSKDGKTVLCDTCRNYRFKG